MQEIDNDRINRRGWIIGGLYRTEGRLILLTLMLVTVGIAAGLTGAVSVQSRASRLDDVAGRSDPVSAAALEVYRSLSDADAAVASSMLADGTPSQELYERYRADIARTAAALGIAMAGAPADPGATGDTGAGAAAQLSNLLPVYTGLVETARTYSRQGMPMAWAYLRQASGLVRATMLPLAEQLFLDETAHKTTEQVHASQAPWAALALMVLMIGGLLSVQVYLNRRTNRLFNVGLVAATLAALGGLAWLAVSATEVAVNVRASQTDGTAQITAIAKSRIAGLQAHADEAMRLFARGSEADFEKSYDETINRLTGPQGSLAAAKTAVSQPDTRAALDAADRALTDWRNEHREMRRLDDTGQYAGAVQKADDLVRLADDYDRQLDQAMRQANDRFEAASREAHSAVRTADIAVAILLGLAVFLAVAGMWPRIAEYR